MNARLKTMAWLAAIAAVVCWDASAQTAPGDTSVIPDTPECLRIAADCVTARQTADLSRRAELRGLIQVQIDEAEALLKEKKKSGNIKGIAVATQARQMFESALTNLNATGRFELPERVRRELDDTVQHFNGARAGIEARASNEIVRIQKEHLERLAPLIARVRPDTQAATLAAAFTALVDRLMTHTPPPPAPPAGTNAATPGAAATNAPADVATLTPAVPVLPEILGESGPAARWVTVGRVTADMMGVDVLDFSLANRAPSMDRSEKFNPITQQSSTIDFVSIYPLPASTGLVYRLKRLQDREGVQILDWPGPRNTFTLTVRTMPSATFPRPHGFEIQVGGSDALLSSLFAGAPVEAIAGAVATQKVPIIITVMSKPSGAAVLVDGALVQGVHTPCRLRLPPATQSLRLVLPGYLDGVVSNRDITAGGTLSWSFTPDPRIVRKTVIVPADTPGWIAVAEVQAGARIAVDAQGSWSCAGSPTGPEGHPNNEANYRLYMNPADYPRQTPGANHGALIWRIAPKGRPGAVGRSLRTVARESGALQFDINEAPGPEHRADNTGALSVTLVILPPATP